MTSKYESPLSSRYASEYMLKLFSSDVRYQTWRKLWVALARAEMNLGLPITDEQVAQMIESCGFTLWIADGKKYNASKAFESGKTVTLRLQNFDVKNYGEVQVHGNVFLELKDGTIIESSECSFTLRQLLENIAVNAESYTDTQLSAVKAMIQKYEAEMADWNIESLR